MASKNLSIKPKTPGQRGMSARDFSMVTSWDKVKGLVTGRPGRSGRNNNGRITIRHRSSGGRRHLYRTIDYKRAGERTAEVINIIFDPNRSARLAHIKYDNGDEAYILACQGIKVGDKLVQGEKAPIKDGNTLPLMRIPSGLMIHNVEMRPGQGGILARSAGTYAIMQGLDHDYALIKLHNGEVKRIQSNCLATLGQLGNIQHANLSVGKAGRSRHFGRRPTVRGKAMNPDDHPHGGGEGGTSIGLRKGPKTKWGAKALGVKTRARRKPKLIK